MARGITKVILHCNLGAYPETRAMPSGTPWPTARRHRRELGDNKTV